MNELRAVAGYANEQVLVLFRMGLCVKQGFRGQRVELNVERAHIEEGLHHGRQIAATTLRFNKVVTEAHVQKRATGVNVLIHLCASLHRCQRRGRIGAANRGNAFENRFRCLTTASGRA